MNSNPVNKEHLKRSKDEAQKKLKDNINFEVILSGVFCLFGSIFAAFAMLGFKFDFSTFTDPSFYISTAISWGIMMYVYNFSKPIFIKTFLNKDGTDYKKHKAREGVISKYVHDWLHEDLISKAVENENDTRRKSAAQQILDNITYGLDAEKIEDTDDPNNIAVNEFAFKTFVKKRDLSRRQAKKLRKAIRKVLHGKYSYESLATRDLLANTTGERQDTKQMTINSRKEDLKENRNKVITSALATAIVNMLVWRGVGLEFWVGLLAQLMLIFSNLFGAYMAAVKRFKVITFITANRNEFLYNALKNELKKIPLGVSPMIDDKPALKKDDPIIAQPSKDNVPAETGLSPMADRMLKLNDTINNASG